VNLSELLIIYKDQVKLSKDIGRKIKQAVRIDNMEGLDSAGNPASEL
jgi:hypothetical protein